MNQVSATPSPVRFIRFGLFEADLQAGELRKNGLKIKLQDQPFRVLSLLLERAGEVVTREEFRQKLWSTDTFVDFDHGLNTSIKKLRQALGTRPTILALLRRWRAEAIGSSRRWSKWASSLSNSNLVVDKVADDSVSPASPAELLEIEKGPSTKVDGGLDVGGRFDRADSRGCRLALLPSLCVVATDECRPFHQLSRQRKGSCDLAGRPAVGFRLGRRKRQQFRCLCAIGRNRGRAAADHREAVEADHRPGTGRQPDLVTGRALPGFCSCLGRQQCRLCGAIDGRSGAEIDRTILRVWSEGKSLDWSPDGKSLAVAAKNSPEDPYSLYSISLDTGDDRRSSRHLPQSLEAISLLSFLLTAKLWPSPECLATGSLPVASESW